MRKKASKKRVLQPKLHIRKGDIVKVISGADKGKQGRVLDVAGRGHVNGLRQHGSAGGRYQAVDEASPLCL